MPRKKKGRKCAKILVSTPDYGAFYVLLGAFLYFPNCL